jgi:hypothetical protein
MFNITKLINIIYKFITSIYSNKCIGTYLFISVLVLTSGCLYKMNPDNYCVIHLMIFYVMIHDYIYEYGNAYKMIN